jgi:hypothetical protein
MTKKLCRFEDIDVLSFLGEIVKRHVQHYMNDFDLDEKLIRRIAKNGGSEDRRLLWMARPSGTWCMRERDAHLQGSWAHSTWKFYGEQTSDRILAYALELKNVAEGGAVIGTVHELDYAAHLERLKMLALLIAVENYVFGDGTVCAGDRRSFKATSDELKKKYGKEQTAVFVQCPESEAELAMILKRERMKRDYNSMTGDMGEHIRALFGDEEQRPSVRQSINENKLTAAVAPTRTAKGGPER